MNRKYSHIIFKVILCRKLRAADCLTAPVHIVTSIIHPRTVLLLPGTRDQAALAAVAVLQAAAGPGRATVQAGTHQGAVLRRS